MLKSWSRQAPAMLVGLALIAAVFVGPTASADHEPANKVAAAGSTTEVLDPEVDQVVLQERVKVSSSFDLILSLSSECSILTALRTGDNDAGNPATDTANSFGQLVFYLTIDGKRVPVTYTDEGNKQEPTETDEPAASRPFADGTGEVVFCNREYQRTVTDSENNGQTPDGIDTQEDFIRTRTANAFNWLARDVGFNYDIPDNGNNVVDIKVFARFNRNGPGCLPSGLPAVSEDSCSNAIVGRRTLIAEPTNASVHEWVKETDAEGGN